jgi:hypothetical protein
MIVDMRKLTVAEIARASDPRSELYQPPPNSQSVPPGSAVARSVHLDGEYVLVDRVSFAKVCAKLGIAER